MAKDTKRHDDRLCQFGGEAGVADSALRPTPACATETVLSKCCAVCRGGRGGAGDAATAAATSAATSAA
jgi:hypothetical protein